MIGRTTLTRVPGRRPVKPQIFASPFGNLHRVRRGWWRRPSLSPPPRAPWIRGAPGGKLVELRLRCMIGEAKLLFLSDVPARCSAIERVQ